MPTRSGPPKPPGPRAVRARRRRAPARSTRATAARPPASREAAGPAAPRPAPPVERTCYEVRLMVCPRNPATCPDVRPAGPRVLCGSLEMLARFEKAGGAEEHATEAGFSEALSGLTITRRPDADPDERDEDEGRGRDGDAGSGDE